MAGYRPPYTIEEDTLILKIIVEAKCFYKLRGNGFWKDLSQIGAFDRTWQSLKERFRKIIMPDIFSDKYDIPEAHKRMIYLGFDQTRR